MMLRKMCSLIGLAILAVTPSSWATSAPTAIASRQLPATALLTMKPQHPSENLKKYGVTKSAGIKPAVSSGVPGIDSIVNWTGQFESPGYDSNGNPQSVWQFSMVGNSPQSRQSALIEAPVVPVTVQLLAPDGSVALTLGPDGKVITAALESPEFVPNFYTNGFGQFNDQLLRAEFANVLHGGGGEDWHTILFPKLRKGRTITVPYLTAGGTPAWYYFTNAAGQPILAAIDDQTFGNLLFPPTYPVDNSTPVGAAELAGDITTHDLSTFLFNNTVLFSGGDINNCCILGFHSYDYEPGTAKNGNLPRLYVMDYATWISPGLFLFGFGDMTPWSHEMAEAINDPFDNNETPWWLSVDPFTGGGNCQNDLEVGDVVEVLDSLNPVSTIPGNGLTYHPQNMALFPWFAFQSPSTANLGAYSFPDETTLTSLSPGPLLPGCVAAP
jgi:hypothetical protein